MHRYFCDVLNVAFAEIGNTISNLFGGGKKEEVKEGNVEDEPKEDIPAEVSSFHRSEQV